MASLCKIAENMCVHAPDVASDRCGAVVVVTRSVVAYVVSNGPVEVARVVLDFQYQ